ncbi:MAG: CapA family protein [Candidatus Thorarchaeota archaeon]
MISSVSMGVVGDISFKGRHQDNPSKKLFSNVIPIFNKSDLLIANLECPLIHSFYSKPMENKCTLRGNPGWAEILRDSGVNILSLANNHIMDFGEDGLYSTIDALEKNKIIHLGAGKNIDQACAPVFINKSDLKLALLARSSVIVSSPSYADKDRAGVAFFNLDETVTKVKFCKENADFVILLMHWGLENYLYPSPKQRDLANILISNGIDIIIGHHPHVIQGIEWIKDKPVIYSLGNFLFDEFTWEYEHSNGVRKKNYSRLSSDNREGIIANFTLNKNDRITFSSKYTRIDYQGIILLNQNPSCHSQLDKISRRLKVPFYSLIWKLYSVRMEWSLRFKERFSPKKIMSNLSRIRFHHIKEILVLIKKSIGIASEKTTNPYE